MTKMHLSETMKAKNLRYDMLDRWSRLDLERHAIALTGQKTLMGVTKIRLLRVILLAEFPIRTTGPNDTCAS